MIRAFLVVALVAVVALLLYARTRPDAYRIERSTRIEAPPERIYGYMADFRGFQAWLPYEHKDPDMERRYSGAASGVGAVYEFAGDSRVGTGRMEILELTEPTRVRMSLDMLKPMEAHNIVEFSLRPDGDGTVVSWAMEGRNPYIAKLLGIFVNMDGMIGRDFEEGLATLKAVVEKGETP
jgi:uncharacterized protein YndB with AHSA1/START domain